MLVGGRRAAARCAQLLHQPTQLALGWLELVAERTAHVRDLEVVLLDVLTAAYARGAYDAAPGGAPLRWVPDRPGQCPDCDDNALEATVKSKLFPTGQAFPPAHPGCRCIVVPADDEPDRKASVTDR